MHKCHNMSNIYIYIKPYLISFKEKYWNLNEKTICITYKLKLALLLILLKIKNGFRTRFKFIICYYYFMYYNKYCYDNL